MTVRSDSRPSSRAGKHGRRGVSESRPAPSVLLAGSTLLGRFDVVAHVASGGMGDVYRGVDRGTGETVAIKVCSAADDPDFVRRFLREGRLLSELSHPRVVGLRGRGALPDETPFYVMEYVAAPTLAEILVVLETVPYRAAVAIAIGILEGLVALHIRGIFHRDITPKNIAVDPETLAVKVLDLGLAKEAVDYGPPLTKKGTYVGTPGYMAPEQALGHADARSDLYAVGTLLYQMIRGRRPFAERGVRETAARISTDAPRLEAPSTQPRVPDALADAVAAAIDRFPDARPENSTTFIVKLARAVPNWQMSRTEIRQWSRALFEAPPESVDERTAPGLGAMAAQNPRGRWLVGVRRPSGIDAQAARRVHALFEEPRGFRHLPPDIVLVEAVASRLDEFLHRLVDLGPSIQVACEPLLGRANRTKGYGKALGVAEDGLSPEAVTVLADLFRDDGI